MRRKAIILILALLAAFVASLSFISSAREGDLIVPSAAFSHVGHLSDYEPSLADGPMDAPVFFFDSGKEGATVFIAGGAHPNESAGILSAILVMENLEVSSGRVIVMPVMNLSAYSETLAGFGYPERYQIGGRSFKIGSRNTRQVDQWPDPFIFFQYPSGQGLSYEESRNINRAFPGKEDGSLTQRAALAIMKLLEDEGVDYAFDLHEASVTYPVNQTIVTSDGHYDVAYLASLLLQEAGHDMRAEVSAAGNEGYTHRAWNGIEGLSAFLIEVPTPFIDRIPGAMTHDGQPGHKWTGRLPPPPRRAWPHDDRLSGRGHSARAPCRHASGHDGNHPLRRPGLRRSLSRAQLAQWRGHRGQWT